MRSSILPLFLGLAGVVACAAPAPGKTKSNSTTINLGEDTDDQDAVSGFDFTGPKRRTFGESCANKTAMADAVEAACLESAGQLIEAERCELLCSAPIAPEGKVAGYDFNGFAILDAGTNNDGCREINTAELLACSDAEGKATTTKSCRTLCSKPIAPPGKVAGYLGNKYGTGVPAAEGSCNATAYLPEEITCVLVGGEPRRLKSCTTSLCTLPY